MAYLSDSFKAKRRSNEDPNPYAAHYAAHHGGYGLTERRSAPWSRPTEMDWTDRPASQSSATICENAPTTRQWAALAIVGLLALFGVVYWYSESSATPMITHKVSTKHASVPLDNPAKKSEGPRKMTAASGSKQTHTKKAPADAPEVAKMEKLPKTSTRKPRSSRDDGLSPAIMPALRQDTLRDQDVQPVKDGHQRQKHERIRELYDRDEVSSPNDHQIDPLDSEAKVGVEVSPLQTRVNEVVSRLADAEVAYARKIRMEAEASDVKPIDMRHFTEDTTVHSQVEEIIAKPEEHGCVDTEPECHYWASLGECTGNPGWMNKKCCQACQKVVNKRLKVCIDEEPECTYWASLGECSTNEGTMSVKCCKTCSKVMDINYGLPD